nr:zinc finger, CCHC-type [Tanacetum cinerariifolium]
MVESDKHDKTSSSASVREQGNISLQCPKLTETALMMETILKAYGLWKVIDETDGKKETSGKQETAIDEKAENTTKGIIFQTLPQDMLMQVAQYTTAKEVWNSIKVKHIVADLVQKACLKTLRSELEKLKMKPNESANEFAGKLSSIQAKFKSLGGTLKDKVLVRKLLNSVPKKFLPIVVSIEQYQEIDTMQFKEAGFRGARKLKRGSLYLYMGNGMRAEVEAIGSFDLHLPNGLVIVLDNCYYAPTITRGVVSVSKLVNKGFSHCFTNYGLSVSMNNIIYFNAITVNDVFEIDMPESTLPIVNSMYSISNKKAKSSLDSSYLWHCRLAHIDKKRIKKSQMDGILKSMDNEPYDKCESCISGKMTKKPFLHKTEKVNDASYFITFTDDYSRYGYVYLLKHKHEVFETFKVCKNEVENQLGKIIKALRSDRGETAARILNMVPTKKVEKTPYELWHGKVPNLSYLKKSGRTVELDDEDTISSENTSKHPIEAESLALIIKEDVVPVRRCARTPKAPNRLCLNVEIVPDQLYFNVEVEEHSLGDKGEPANLPPSAKVVKSKWIYKKKTDMDGVVYIYKARLVAKGFTQTYGVDYEETFLPVADIMAIRILIAITAYYDYEIWQMDVKTAFLNEAEYIAAVEAAKEAVWIRKKFHYVRECVETGEIEMDKVHTDDNLADPFMKALAGPKLTRHARSMGLRPASSFIFDQNRMTTIHIYFVMAFKKQRDCKQFETDRDDRKSQTGYVFTLNEGAVVWKSFKQSTTAQHAVEAEYIAAAEAVKEAVWIRKFVDELGIVPSNNYPIEMNCDNTAAISMAKEPGIMKGARHFQRKFHYVRECVETGEIKMVKVHIDENLADPFTKALAGLKLT